MPKKDVHTRHCCKTCGCKYNEDDICSVVQGKARQERPCGQQDVCDEYEDICGDDYSKDDGREWSDW